MSKSPSAGKFPWAPGLLIPLVVVLELAGLAICSLIARPTPDKETAKAEDRSVSASERPASDANDKGNSAGPPADRVIDVVTWVAGKEAWKTPATYFVRGNKVTGQMDHTYEPTRTPHYSQEPRRNQGAFTGTIQGTVIAGEWKIDILPNRIVITGTDGKSFDRLDSGSVTATTRTVLNPDGTLTETQKGSGMTQWKWGPNAPDPNKQSSFPWNLAVPGEHFPQPVQGTWKERTQ